MGTVDLADATEVDTIGTKAANLGELIRAGFEVPAAYVVPATIADSSVAEAVAEALGWLKGDRFAVRSSAVAEDTAEASFAGQYETFLGVSRERVAEAVRSCRESGKAQRVVAYREKQGFGDAPSTVAVIVQELVDAAAAGVAFSADPVTGARDRVLVSAVKGLGERLVSGQTGADEWAIEDGKAACEAAPEGAIDGDTALRVAALARAAAEHFGHPQDIEWALDRDGRLFLLQARPITALPEEARWEAPDGGSYVRNYRLGEWFYEPLTPLFDDWCINYMEARWRELAHRYFGFSVHGRSHVLVNGWYFNDLGFLPQSMGAIAGMFLRHFVTRAIWSPHRLRLMLPPIATVSVRAHLEELRRHVQPANRRLVEDSEQRLETADFNELVTIVDRLADDAGESFFYIVIVGGYAWKSELKLAQFCRAHLADSGLASHQELLLGCFEPIEQPFKVISLDWYRPLLTEHASSESAVEAAARHSRLLVRRREAESAARAALADRPRLLRRFDALLSVAQEFAAVREEQVAEFTRGWPVFRAVLRQLGDLFVSRKVLAESDEIYFLTRGEVIGPSGDLTATTSARRETWERQKRLAPPLRLGPVHPLIRQIMDDQISTFRAPGQATGDELLTGIPSSPGVACGRVRVVTGPEAFDTFEAGEILVARATTPGWTPLFARAAAVVTDVGSVMAHASLVAREFGIPAVVGAGDATQRLRDGMLVTVDGSAGVVLQTT